MRTTKKLSKWCKNTLMILPAVALMAVACEKEQEHEDTPNPFEGADNHVTSFVLTKGDVSYTAAVAAGTITVTVPANVSLSGFTAAYQLCENATINPDPAEITDWNSEQQFAVTAYNGAKTTYKYMVAHSDVVHAGAVVLKTQAEVDAFGQGGYTVINGYLAIGAATGTDTITSLASLAGLKAVTDDITVNATYGGESLTAFEQLETVGELHVLSKQVKTVRFPVLKTVRTNMNFDQANAIETLDFPELTTIEKGLRLYLLDSLATLNFPKLQQVLENVTIEGRSGTDKQYLQAVHFPELAGSGIFTLTNLNSLERVSAPKLETTAGFSVSSVLTEINLSALTTVNGDVTLSGSTATTSLPLSKLTTASGTLSLNFPGVTSLDGLSSLKKVGTLSAVDLRGITAIDIRNMEIGSLNFSGTTLAYTTGITVTGNETFAGRLYCSFPNTITPVSSPNFPIAVEGIKKLGELEFVGSGTGAGADVDIDLSWLEELDGLLNISSLRFLKSIDLSNLKKAGGLRMASLLSLQTLNLSSLQEIGGDFELYIPGELTVLSLPELKSVGGNMDITGFQPASVLATISCPKLTTITGRLYLTPLVAVQNNAVFTDLSGFSALTSVGDRVEIRAFTNLKDFCPLNGVIPSLTTAKWYVARCGYNVTYQQMIDGNCSN